MTEYILNYPGDPPCKVQKMTRAEFLDMFPPDDRKIVITSESGREEFPMGTQIYCDMCNENPGDEIWLLYGDYAKCGRCIKEDMGFMEAVK